MRNCVVPSASGAVWISSLHSVDNGWERLSANSGHGKVGRRFPKLFNGGNTARGNVRRQDDVLHGEQRMANRDRLGVENIEGGCAQMAALENGGECFWVDKIA